MSLAIYEDILSFCFGEKAHSVNKNSKALKKLEFLALKSLLHQIQACLGRWDSKNWVDALKNSESLDSPEQSRFE